MDGIQLENLIKAVESCFKQNYCALYFEDLVRKFRPEITEDELRTAVKTMYNREQLTIDGDMFRLIVK